MLIITRNKQMSKHQELSDTFIRESNIEDLEKELEGREESEIMKIKCLRRKLKQRGYKNCYDKKIRETDKDLVRDIARLREEKTALIKERKNLLAEISLYSRFM